MESYGAYGGGKAGGAFDPKAFVNRPQVILRFICWLCAVIIFGCISTKGWYTRGNQEECIFNKDSSACNYGVGISVIGFLASMGFLAGEYFFEQMSSVKTRKHYVLADLGFSGFWSFLYVIAFLYLACQWNSSDVVYPTGGFQAKLSIACSLVATLVWGYCAYFAYDRYRLGADAAFATNYEAEVTMPSTYTSYPGGPDSDQNYQEPPFSGMNQRGPTDFQAPAY